MGRTWGDYIDIDGACYAKLQEMVLRQQQQINELRARAAEADILSHENSRLMADLEESLGREARLCKGLKDLRHACNQQESAQPGQCELERLRPPVKPILGTFDDLSF